MWVTKQLPVAIDFHSREKNTMQYNTIRQLTLVTNFLKVYSFVFNGRVEGEYIMIVSIFWGELSL